MTLPRGYRVRWSRVGLVGALALISVILVATLVAPRPAPRRLNAANVSPTPRSPASFAPSLPPSPVGPSPAAGPAAGTNVYAGAGVGMFSPNTAGALARVYVPNSESNTVDVIDPNTYQILSSFPVPARPQHVVPSWDMKTLYVNSDVGNALTPIDPKTGAPGAPIPVTDPYNLYFTPDGSKAIVVPERYNALDFRDPHTFALIKRVSLPCVFPNHMDFTADGHSLVTSCENSGHLVRVNVDTMEVTGSLYVRGSPQDIRLSSDGTVFFVADQQLNGIDIIDANSFKELSFLPTGAGTHGMYPSRDGSLMYVSNRVAGTITVLSMATHQILTTWNMPGTSPDMGGVSPDGKQLWLSGRYNSEIYVIDTANGSYRKIPVGKGPHGLCLFPQPGRISLGHTGNYR